MKKIFFLITTAMLPIASYSQITGGGSGNSNVDNQSVQSNEKGAWKNRFNINIGLNKPLGTWKELPALSSTLSDAYLQNTGFGVTSGFSIELGSVFYLKQIMPVLDDKVKFAINTSWIDFNIMPIKNGWESLGGIYKTASYTPFYFISMKVGVLGSYNFYEKNYVDVYINLNPTLSIAGSMYSYNSGDYNFSTSGSGFGNRFCVGINYRISVFNVGTEFILGHIKYNGNVNISDTQSSSLVANSTYRTKFTTNTLRFKIGCSF